MKLYFSIAVFGLLGIFLRFGIDRSLTSLTNPSSFPWGIWFVNILGCILAGLLSQSLSFSSEIKIGLLVGFCGGFTTFSTYALQSVALWEEGKRVLALIYGVGSPVVGILATFVSIECWRRCH